MKTRLLVGLSLIVVVPALTFLLDWRGLKQISVNGKPILDWAIQLNGPQGIQEAEKVIRQTGSAAVPSLIAALEARDSLLKKPFLSIASRLPERFRTGLHRRINPYDKDRLRLGAVRALEILGATAEKAAPSLGRALRDANPEISMHAAFALGRMGAHGVPKLVEALNDPRESIQFMAIQGLGMAGSEAQPAVPLLIRALRVPNKRISEQAMNSLILIRGERTVAFLAEMLREPELRLTILAARTLAGIGPQARAAVPALVEAAQSAEAAGMISIVDALGRIQPSNSEVSSILRTALHNADASVRARAAEGLNRSAATAGPLVPALIETLNDPFDEVRRSATIALGTIAAQNEHLIPLIIPALITRLEDRDFLARLFAAQGLARLGPAAATAVTALTAALKDSHPGVRSCAAFALGAIGPSARSAQSELEILFADSDKGVSGAARNALQQIALETNH
ncbi:MAG: HEAT repeat domain-containing protein [Verrucomicrobia bacterium]|nr:HEAT repeat domain-containing protein [Verrucomicrobiota bacterium]